MSSITTVISLITIIAASGNPHDILKDRIIYNINIEADDTENIDIINNLIDISPGYSYSRRAVRQAVMRLYNTGRYADIEVHAGRNGSVVELTFKLYSKRYIDDISILGQKILDRQQILTAINIEPGQELSSFTIQELKDKVSTYCFRKGYRQAKIRVDELSPAQAKKVSIGIFIDLQSPTYIEEITFTGNPHVVAHLLHNVMTSKVGHILDMETLDDDIRKLEIEYRKRGFLESSISEPQVSLSQTGKATVTIPIESDYRILFAFQGNTIFTDSFLFQLLALRNDERLSQPMLEDFRYLIHRTYQQRGYYEAKVSFEPFINEKTITKTYLYTISQGRFLPITQLQITGSTFFDEDFLKEELFAIFKEIDSQQSLGSVWNSTEVDIIAGPRTSLNLQASQNSHLQSQNSYKFYDRLKEIYVPDLYKKGIDHLTAIYRANGYLSVTIQEPILSITPRGLIVSLIVTEGPQTIIHQMSLQGLNYKQQALFNKSIPLQRGFPLSETALENSRLLITNYFAEQGYLFIQVIPKVTISQSGTSAKIELKVSLGPQVKVGQIILKGVQDTNPTIILSQLELHNGKTFTPQAALETRRNLSSLGIFSSARVELVEPDIPSEFKDVVISIKERRRNDLGLGIGLTTEDGISGAFRYNHHNMFGMALGLSTSAKINRQLFFPLYGTYKDAIKNKYAEFHPIWEALERRFLVSIQAPYLFILPRSLNLELSFLEERDNTLHYILTSRAATFSMNYKLINKFFAILEQSIVYNDLQPSVSNANEPLNNPIDNEGRLLNISEGIFTLYKIEPRLRFDRRDNPFNPKRGYVLDLFGGYAHGLRNPIRFFKVEAHATGYLPINRIFSFALSARMGQIFNIGSDFPISDSFYLGGRNSLRGFLERSLVPSDVCVIDSNGQTLSAPSNCSYTLVATTDSDTGKTLVQTEGGRSYVLGKAELRIRIINELSLGLFGDIGNLTMKPENLFSTQFRIGTGFGLRYETPLGIVAFDMGFNPTMRENLNEESFQFHFAIGQF